MIAGHVFIAMSLDGYIARTDGDIAWLLARDDPAEDHGYDAFIKDIDVMIMGRGSYEKILSLAPWPYTKPVVVLSRSLASTKPPQGLEGKVRFLDLTPQEAMATLSREGCRHVYVDGGQIVQAFLREKLIRTMVVTIVPVLIGQGRPLFGALKDDISLELVESKSFASGLAQLTYRILS